MTKPKKKVRGGSQGTSGELRPKQAKRPKLTEGGVRLRRWLERDGSSISDFAVLMDVTPNTVSRWLAGWMAPQPETALAIEEVTRGKVSMASWLRDAT